MHFFLDHDWMSDMGENLPTYRPPLNSAALFGEPRLGERGDLSVAVRYLTPHNKWSIHSEYQDNLFMLSLSRGGTSVWMSDEDAALIEVRDNDWVECVNTNGVFVGRAIVTSRMRPGAVFVHHAQERTIDVPKSEATAAAAASTTRSPGSCSSPRTWWAATPSSPGRSTTTAPPATTEMSPRSSASARRRSSTDAHHGSDRDGHDPRQVPGVPRAP